MLSFRTRQPSFPTRTFFSTKRGEGSRGVIFPNCPHLEEFPVGQEDESSAEPLGKLLQPLGYVFNILLVEDYPLLQRRYTLSSCVST